MTHRAGTVVLLIVLSGLFTLVSSGCDWWPDEAPEPEAPDPLDSIDRLTSIRIDELLMTSRSGRTAAAIDAAAEAFELTSNPEIRASLRSQLEAMSRWVELPSRCTAALALAQNGAPEDLYRAFRFGCAPRPTVSDAEAREYDRAFAACVLTTVDKQPVDRQQSQHESSSATITLAFVHVFAEAACRVQIEQDATTVRIRAPQLELTPVARELLFGPAALTPGAVPMLENSTPDFVGEGISGVAIRDSNLVFSIAEDAAVTPSWDPGTGRLRLLIDRSEDPFLVVLDPGHGGEETGARYEELTEASLVLDLALRAERILRTLAPKITVVLTRRDDSPVPLEDRARLANRYDADAFVSIHLNALNEPVRTGGITTFVLDTSGSTQALRLAARENGTNVASVSRLQHLLATLHRQTQGAASANLADALQTSVLTHARRQLHAIPDRGVRQAAFYVLVGARMPAVLLEASFLTKPEEAAALRTETYRELLAMGIARGIAEFAEGVSRAAETEVGTEMGAAGSLGEPVQNATE